MCKECEAKIKGLFKMGKTKKRAIRGLDAAGMLSTAKSVGAGFVGYYAADYATENVEFLKANLMTDGLVKVGSALGLSAIPQVANSDMASAGIIGWGIQGIKQIVNSFTPEGKPPYVAGYADWDSYDKNQHGANRM